MDFICVWFGCVCRDYVHSGEMRDQENRFQCGYGDPDDGGFAVFMADGIYYRLPVTDRIDRRQDMAVPCFVGPCHRGVMALLF